MNSQSTIRAMQRQAGLSHTVVVARLKKQGLTPAQGKRDIKVIPTT